MSASQSRLEIYIDGLAEGGAEFLILDMLPSFKEHFAEVEVIALHGPRGLEDRFSALVPVTRVSKAQMLRRLWSSRELRYVNLARPQAFASIVAILRRLLGARSRSRVVCHEHASFAYYQGRGGVVGLFDSAFRGVVEYCVRRRMFGYILATNARLAELASIVANGADVIVVPNSVSAARMRALQSCRDSTALGEKLRTSNHYRFFTLSRLHPIKQIDWAIDAVAALAAESTDATFTLAICGKGPELENLRQHASRYAGLTNLTVDFVGFVDRLETPASTAHAFLFPSKAEGFPVSLTEAVLTGITAVATDCPHGPADLAPTFPNLTLASPPTHAQFVDTVRRVFHARIRRDVWKPDTVIDTWPTSEETARRISDFIKQTPSDDSRRG